MNDENNYLTKTEKSLLQRIGSFFSRNPSSSDEVADMLRSAENESIIDADALQIMAVSYTHLTLPTMIGV